MIQRVVALGHAGQSSLSPLRQPTFEVPAHRRRSGRRYNRRCVPVARGTGTSMIRVISSTRSPWVITNLFLHIGAPWTTVCSSAGATGMSTILSEIHSCGIASTVSTIRSWICGTTRFCNHRKEHHSMGNNIELQRCLQRSAGWAQNGSRKYAHVMINRGYRRKRLHNERERKCRGSRKKSLVDVGLRLVSEERVSFSSDFIC